MTGIRIISNNVRELGTQHKRRDVLHYLRNMNCDIILLQDTHLTKEKMSSFNSLWSGKAYHSCYSNNSRGSSILISKNIQHNILNEFTSNTGNYIMLECKIGPEIYLLGSIYGPNRDEPQFYEQIGNIFNSVDYDHVVIGGDFNFVSDAEIDCYGYSRESNVKARKTFFFNL